MAFDVLAADGRDVRPLPLRERRAVLERLAAGWAPPLQVSPVTTSESQARAWFVDYRPAGIEGLVVKAASGVYVPGRRDWVKVKSRETAEVIVGAVTGPIRQAVSVVVSLIAQGQLVIVGKSGPCQRPNPRRLGRCSPPPVPTTRGPTKCPPTGSGRHGPRSP